MIIKRKTNSITRLATSGVMATAGVALVGLAAMPAFAAGGFNENGYNYDAHIFVGKADGTDKMLDGKVWGDPTYANDHLVMKWNKEWDDCNANGYDNPEYCAGAWTTNQWSGMSADGSKTTSHYKIVWVGSAGENSEYWVDGGYSIWGNYEVIFDKGTNADHTRYESTLATPNGLGQNK